jgi:branched-chain amino acid transport system permease protein
MRYTKIGTLLILLILIIILPFVSPDATITSIGFFALLYACAATAWNIFSGYTGYISLGHATFYGLGTYTLAIICEHWNIPGGYTPFLLLPVAGLIAAIFALPLGWIALRTQQITFVVVTLAILFIFQLLAYNLSGITHGSRGMFFPFPPWSGDSYNFPFYYVALILVLLTLGVSWWVLHSKYGLGLLAIRDDEDRALSLGVKTTQGKLSAFVISAFFMGMVGALGSYFLGYVSPSFAFSPAFDVTIALMVLFGGVGTLAGPILGALLLEPLQQYLTLQSNIRGADLVLFGGLLLIVLIVLPEGVIPAGRRRWIRWKNMRATKQTALPFVKSNKP